jgi:excisionase family DNA binding protein
MIRIRIRRIALNDERWLTVSDIADQLQVDEQTVRRWIRAGKIKARSLGGKAGYRVLPSDLSAYMKSLPMGNSEGSQPEKWAA